MKRSIVPKGFEFTAHRIFNEYVPPLPIPKEVHRSSYTSNYSSNNSIKVPSVLSEITSVMTSNSKDLDFICAVCLSHCLDPVTLVNCRHMYCMSCLLIWFKAKLQCPLCKATGAYFLQSKTFDKCGIQLFSVDGSGLEGIDPCDLQIAINVHQDRMDYLKEKDIIPKNHLNTNKDISFLDQNYQCNDIKKSEKNISADEELKLIDDEIRNQIEVLNSLR